jgi:hypothetical protein
MEACHHFQHYQSADIWSGFARTTHTFHAWTCIQRADYQVGSSRHQRQASELAETQMTARNARKHLRHKIGNTPRMPTERTEISRETMDRDHLTLVLWALEASWKLPCRFFFMVSQNPGEDSPRKAWAPARDLTPTRLLFLHRTATRKS